MATSTENETKFTHDDYMKLPEGYPVELIEGEFVKEPAPTHWHQWVVVEIAVRLRDVAGPHRVLVSPVDFHVDLWNVLQPDVVVFSKDDPVTRDSRPETIPLLTVEVLSPSTACRDRDRKTGIYLRAGVAEVWLVDPDAGTIEIHARGDATTGGGTDAVRRFAPDDVAESRALPGFRTSWRDLAGRG